MLLNRVEKLLMNNPIREAAQRHVEARRLLSMGGRVSGGTALEIGCGRGVGTELILDVFGADRVEAFDLDVDMVERAQARLADRGGVVKLWEGDATAIDAEDATYDAAFDFGIIHHIPNWRDALGEIFRVMKPGARFYAEEVLVKFIHHPLWRRVLDHPMDDRFDHDQFRDALEDAGFTLVESWDAWGRFAFFVADKPR
jgi:ubiquinone/menaquinone biosynthesis C-methylase UbiE